ncbi:restriction endonuclease subunit S [Pseudomonas aeruginosa]|uniref:restriction endonuclease subunit S n=1 Tax=Pseudomonas aeruginosa TaxID=287 RepID=UPI0031B72E01
MSWKELQLGDGIHVKHGFAFKGEYFASSGEYMVLTPGNFLEKGGFRVRDGKERYYHTDFPEDYLLSEGDLIVAMTEQGEGLLGSAARIPAEGKYLHNQRLGLVQIVRPDLLDKRFLYWVFNSSPVRAQIRATATGAKVKHTAPERIKKVRFMAPELREQQAVAFVLDSYDELIATNQRRIALLEGAARRLYREWFVQLRFPGHELVPVKDRVPEGWGKSSIAEQTSFLNRGIAPKYDDTAKGWVINQKCIRDGRLLFEPARRQSKDVKPERLVRLGDVLINSTGAGTLGRVAQVRSPLVDCTVDTHVTIARPLNDDSATYFGQALLSLESVFAQMGKGATNQLELGRADIGAMEIWRPPLEIQREFHRLAWPMLEQAEQLATANKALAKARDLLLPKLMSGQLDVSGIPLPDEVSA